jgi:hypothetical protein
MKAPTFLDRRTLAKMAAPDETHCVRVILQKVSNSAPYTYRSALRRYLFERDGILGAHILDIPVSLWMAEIPTSGPYRKNASVSDDLKPTQATPFTIQVIPWKGAKAPAVANPDCLPLLREIVSSFNPPPAILTALQLTEEGNLESLEVLAGTVRIFKANPPPVKNPAAEPAAELSPAAARMRKMREAKAAKKLQTA